MSASPRRRSRRRSRSRRRGRRSRRNEDTKEAAAKAIEKTVPIGSLPYITTLWRGIFDARALPLRPETDPLIGTKIKGIPVQIVPTDGPAVSRISFAIECTIAAHTDQGRYLCKPDPIMGFNAADFLIDKSVVHDMARSGGGGGGSSPPPMEPPESWGPTLIKIINNLPLSRALELNKVDAGEVKDMLIGFGVGGARGISPSASLSLGALVTQHIVPALAQPGADTYAFPDHDATRLGQSIFNFSKASPNAIPDKYPRAAALKSLAAGNGDWIDFMKRSTSMTATDARRKTFIDAAMPGGPVYLAALESFLKGCGPPGEAGIIKMHVGNLDVEELSELLLSISEKSSRRDDDGEGAPKPPGLAGAAAAGTVNIRMPIPSGKSASRNELRLINQTRSDGLSLASSLEGLAELDKIDAAEDHETSEMLRNVESQPLRRLIYGADDSTNSLSGAPIHR
jgi:hypothetical protein